MKAQINKIIPFSSVDGRGNRTAIFFQGCNVNCIYCHNKETINKCVHCLRCVDTCKSGALSVSLNKVIFNKDLCCECDMCIKTCNNSSTPKTTEMSIADIMSEIEKYKYFISGITVSGGECTLNEKFLVELFKECKKLSLSCLIDSNGTRDFEKMKDLLDLCDGVMLDVKSFDDDIYNKYIGNFNNIVKKNLVYLLENNKLEEVRTVVMENVLDNENTVQNVSKILSNYPSIPRYKLIKFRNHGTRIEIKSLTSPSSEYMNKLSDIAKKNCKNEIIIL